MVILLGGGICLSLFLYNFLYKWQKIASQIMNETTISMILGEIEEDRYTIIEALPYLNISSDARNISILSLIDKSTGTNLFIWRKAPASLGISDYYFNQMFSDLTIENILSLLKENRKRAKKIFGLKALRKMEGMKLLKKGAFISEYGLKIPYIKAFFQTNGEKILFFATNFAYTKEDSCYEVILVAINGGDRDKDQEFQNMINRILRHKQEKGVSIEETNEAIKNLQDKRCDLKIRKEAIRFLKQIGSDEALEALITALKDKDIEIRREIVYALGELRSKKVVEALCSVLKDDDRGVRRSTTFSLMEINSIYAVDSLINALEDADANVRLMAIQALTRLGDKKAIEPFITLLRKDENKVVRSSAATGLGEIGDRRAIKPLISALKDESEIVRRWTAISLGRIGDETVIPMLSEALQDQDEEVQKAAKEAIEKIKTPGDVHIGERS